MRGVLVLRHGGMHGIAAMEFRAFRAAMPPMPLFAAVLVIGEGEIPSR